MLIFSLDDGVVLPRRPVVLTLDGLTATGTSCEPPVDEWTLDFFFAVLLRLKFHMDSLRFVMVIFTFRFLSDTLCTSERWRRVWVSVVEGSFVSTTHLRAGHSLVESKLRQNCKKKDRNKQTHMR